MEKTDGIAQYKEVLTEYQTVVSNLNNLEKQIGNIKTAGINLEGQMAALRKVFDLKHDEMVKEWQTVKPEAEVKK